MVVITAGKLMQEPENGEIVTELAFVEVELKQARETRTRTGTVLRVRCPASRYFFGSMTITSIASPVVFSGWIRPAGAQIASPGFMDLPGTTVPSGR